MAYIHYCRNIIRQSFDRVLHHPTLFAGQGVRYRKLEVILTTTIDKLGKAGETVKVAPGHFRNHLMPKLLVVPNIDKFAHLISEQHKIYQPKEVEEVKVVHKTEENITKEYQTAAKRLDNAKLVLRRFIKVDNELREPVSKDEIVVEVIYKFRFCRVRWQGNSLCALSLKTYICQLLCHLWESLRCHSACQSPFLCQKGRFSGHLMLKSAENE